MMKISVTKGSDNIFSDIGFNAEKAASLKTRAELMMRIEKTIVRNRWSQAEAARELNVTQPRISDLMRGKIDLFSIDTLVDMLGTLGERTAIVPASASADFQVAIKVNSSERVTSIFAEVELMPGVHWSAKNLSGLVNRSRQSGPSVGWNRLLSISKNVFPSPYYSDASYAVFDVSSGSSLINDAKPQWHAIVDSAREAATFASVRTMGFKEYVSRVQ
jgi:predicted XRE-type DNA-binding protein